MKITPNTHATIDLTLQNNAGQPITDVDVADIQVTIRDQANKNANLIYQGTLTADSKITLAGSTLTIALTPAETSRMRPGTTYYMQCIFTDNDARQWPEQPPRAITTQPNIQ